MNSLTARNAALLLIIYLLWFVFSGIYKNHSQHALASEENTFKQQQITRDQHARRSPMTSVSVSSVASSESGSSQRSLTADEIRQISITGRLPSWAKNADKKRLSVEEVEEIMSSGKLPE